MATIKTVAVFGADGRTGRPLVRRLAAKGYKVTASVYSESAASLFPAGVDVCVGNIMDGTYVRRAMEGADAVISVVGHIKGTDPLMQTKGMQHIVAAMKQGGIRRVLSLTGTGVRLPGDTPSFIDKCMNAFIAHIDPERIEDGMQHAKVLQGSGLDWTILRVLKLTEGKDPGLYQLTDGGPAEWATSREKVAHILVDQLEDDTYYGKMPVSS